MVVYMRESLENYLLRRREEHKLVYLFAELTDKCNLSCLHCGSSCSGANSNYLDADLLISTLKKVSSDFPYGSVMLCLTGGEPLLHPEFNRIVASAHKLGFPWGMTSNGTLIDRIRAEELKLLNMGSISISIDGLEESHDWLRNHKGSFQKAINAVKVLHESGFDVQVTSVFHRKNLTELDAMYQLMDRLNVESWRVINMEPMGRALEYPELLLQKEDYIRLLDFIRNLRNDPETQMEVTYGCSHLLPDKYERKVRGYSFKCGSGIITASILCNGDIYSCLDIERRPEFVQGNIRKDDFTEIWNNGFQLFRQDRSVLNETCNVCNDRRICFGDSGHTWDYNNNKPRLCLRQMLSE